MSKRGQAVQVKRVAAVRKTPKDGLVANVERWNQDRSTTGHTPEPICRRFEGANIISYATGK